MYIHIYIHILHKYIQRGKKLRQTKITAKKLRFKFFGKILIVKILILAKFWFRKKWPKILVVGVFIEMATLLPAALDHCTPASVVRSWDATGIPRALRGDVPSAEPMIDVLKASLRSESTYPGECGTHTARKRDLSWPIKIRSFTRQSLPPNVSAVTFMCVMGVSLTTKTQCVLIDSEESNQGLYQIVHALIWGIRAGRRKPTGGKKIGHKNYGKIWVLCQNFRLP